MEVAALISVGFIRLATTSMADLEHTALANGDLTDVAICGAMHVGVDRTRPRQCHIDSEDVELRYIEPGFLLIREHANDENFWLGHSICSCTHSGREAGRERLGEQTARCRDDSEKRPHLGS